MHYVKQNNDLWKPLDCHYQEEQELDFSEPDYGLLPGSADDSDSHDSTFRVVNSLFN